MAANPGSDEARAAGCTCARMDNNRGKWAPFPAHDGKPDGWWITGDCPVHGFPVGEPVVDVETGGRL